MQLTKNFHLTELTRSTTASRLGIPNNPNHEQIANLRLLCSKVLQPVRNHFKKPVLVTSGFRSGALNKAINGSPTSQHSHGQAADFDIPSVDNWVVADWIHRNLNYDQLILEYYSGGNTGWIHVSYSPRHKNQELTINRRGTFDGLRKR